MNVAPGAAFEATALIGDGGLTGTLGLEANDNTGTTALAFSSGAISEIAPGVYAATGRTAPETAGQYTLIWRASEFGEVLAVDDLVVTYSAPAEPTPGPPVTAYASVDELARILELIPTPAQTDALQRVLDTAALEIDHCLGRSEAFAAPYPALAVQVNLERAAEHWQQQGRPFGIMVLGDSAVMTATDSFKRHAEKLAPLKESWGVA